MLARKALTYSHARLSSTRSIQNPLPAWFLRGGTSKGIFLKEADLPQDRSEWGPIFRGIMGSPDAEYGRQLNGMGGGVSSLSKICVVGHPSEEQKAAQDVDVTYTFVQIGIRDSEVDYSGNCGNLSSMIGVFALDNDLCSPRLNSGTDNTTATVRSYNTNTDKIVETTFPVEPSNDIVTLVLDAPQATIAGVPGQASKIVLDFVHPGGARTGKLLPDSLPISNLTFDYDGTKPCTIKASLVDATNPSIFITQAELLTLSRSILGPDFEKLSAIDIDDSRVLALLDLEKVARLLWVLIQMPKHNQRLPS
ncbi:hypothetical protein QCA50_014457 [Cerrena zonata]|uniref:DUF453-domain-containing protein n=1 Tax=Cerrena zonata TaxID=2478898 RepID=A0AAW0FPK2_9APHY